MRSMQLLQTLLFIVICSFSCAGLTHAFSDQGAGITIQVITSGSDADVPPGPSLVVGEPVFWEYTVTNIGSENLDNISVTDSVTGPVTCPLTTLEPETTMTCFEQGIVLPGQYENIGVVNATSGKDKLSASDPSHYFGIFFELNMSVSINGQIASDFPGPEFDVGSILEWQFVVTNTGNGGVFELQVASPKLGTIICDIDHLFPGMSAFCSVNTIALAGANSSVINAVAIDINTLEFEAETSVEAFYSGIEKIDSDFDGIADSSDNCIEVSNAGQSDFDADGIGDGCDADFNNDCVVNFLDYSEFIAAFQTQGISEYDLNGDLVVNFLDVSIVAGYFFGPPGPSGVSNICGSARQ